MSPTKLFVSSLLMATLAAPSFASMITPDIIFGSGNTNRGFTVVTSGGIELGLRAKRRYAANDAIGVGIVQDADGNYLLDSTSATAPIPSGSSYWNFDWSINSDYVNGALPLDTYSYQLAVDYDPTAGENMQTYDPLGATSTGYYLGNNTTGNGAAAFQAAGTATAADFNSNNVAQNSVNMGFLPGAPIGAGQYRIALSAFDGNAAQVASTEINVFVDTPAPRSVPGPATLALLGVGLAGLGWTRRRKA